MSSFGSRQLVTVLVVVAAIVVGLFVGGVFVGDDDDGDGGDEALTEPTEIAGAGPFGDAEDSAMSLVQAANAGDCDAVQRLATERVATQLTGEINCTNPEVDAVDVLDSAVVDDDPVTVAVVLGRGDARLRIDIEMVLDGNAWRAENYDASD